VLNTILSVSETSHSFTGHFLSVRKSVLRPSMLPNTNLSEHLALSVTGSDWIVPRVHQLVQQLRLEFDVDKIIWGLEVLHALRPAEFKERIDFEVLRHKDELRARLHAEVDAIVAAALHQDPSTATAVNDVVNFLSNVTHDVDSDELAKEQFVDSAACRSCAAGTSGNCHR